MKEPDRIVGELMQPGGCDALRHLGLEWCLEDIDAAECVGYAVILDDKNVILNYPPPNNVEDAAPNEGVVVAGVKGKSFHHGRFIMQLRKAAVQEKKCVTCGR